MARNKFERKNDDNISVTLKFPKDMFSEFSYQCTCYLQVMFLK